MLSIGKLTAGREEYYLAGLAAGQDDYYLDPAETPGTWAGRLAGTLGLAGLVDEAAFKAVLAGRGPACGQLLVVGAGQPGRVTGFDLTFSAPKSVSILWALADPATAAAVADAHDAAVAGALGALEAEAVHARRGHLGVRRLPGDGLVAAGFEHRTSRAGDPQLHTHLVVANLTRAEGRWSAPDGRDLYQWAKTVGYLYQAGLRARLAETLGVTWGPVQRGVADLAGVTRAHIDAFSARRRAITAELDRLGLSSATAARTATLTTRPAKTPGVELADRRAVWSRHAADVGLTPTLVDTLTGPGRIPAPELLDEVLLGGEGLTARASTFDRRAVLQALAAGHPHGAHPTRLRADTDRLLADSRVVAVAAGRYSTTDLLALEADLLYRAANRVDAQVGKAPAAALHAALAERPTLSGEQTEMVERLVTSGAGVEVVVGQAGAGKTFALDAARHAWTTAGHPVIGAALAARAAAELQAGAGIPAMTLDRLLADITQPGPLTGLAAGTVVVLDEAGMVGTRKLARLLDTAEHHQAKVVLVGDHHQLPEIDAGGAFAGLARRLPTIQLADNRRQAQRWERHALADLRAGSAARAVTVLAEHGRLTLAPTAEGARDRLVADWHTAHSQGHQGVMYALRRADVDDLNRRARHLLQADGQLTGPTLDVGGRVFAAGDRVICTRNDRHLGVTNGTVATIQHLDPHTATVTLDTGTVLAAWYVQAGHVAHGYATTVHKAQGQTAERAFLLGSDQLFREPGYVGLSRAKARTDLYLVGDPGPDLLDGLAHTLTVSRRQQLAIDQRPDLETVALADPPPWLTTNIGPPPINPAGRQRWARTAARIYAYRQTHHITDTNQPLGPRPADEIARRQWDLAHLALTNYQSLELDRRLDRNLDRGLER